VDITGVGILNFVPFLASMFVFFTPGLLNRFPKRRWLLAVCKFMYYLLNVAGLTLLPALIEDYTLLLGYAKNNLQMKAINDFIDSKIKSTYIIIDPLFKDCSFERDGWEEKFRK
jgi:hypothetical protein